MKLKAISLWEPWASLIRCGAKRYETRSWPTLHRGPLLICASRRCVKADLLELLSLWTFQGGLAPLVGQELDVSGNSLWPGVRIEDLLFGKAVAVATLADCKPTGRMTQGEIGSDRPFGDFTPGRFAWRLDNVHVIEPFNVTGRQGLFDVDTPERRLVR